ncbi:hypothetical protein [Streptomyces virginiae]|uniref:hypothetical protein n=1 Tax=Streptomyces virginiae TaxID=1961 RepID=UPI003F540079
MTQMVKNWENGRSTPRPPRLQAYLRLLEGWAAKYPAAAPAPAPVAVFAPAPEVAPVPQMFTGPPARHTATIKNCQPSTQRQNPQ